MLALGNADFGVWIQTAVLSCLSSQLPHAQRTAAMLLRSLECEVSFMFCRGLVQLIGRVQLPPTPEFVPLGRLLLRSHDIQVQYEGRMLMKMLVEHDNLRSLTLKALVELLTPSVNVIAEVTRAEGTDAGGVRLTLLIVFVASA
jgi:hypothetical protein